MNEFKIRPIQKYDQQNVVEILERNWVSTDIITRGKIHDATKLPGFVAVVDNEIIGLITYRIEAKECEIITLDSLEEGIGVGTKLIEEVELAAISAGYKRLWLITTNDNTDALRFFQTRGFSLVAVHRNAVTESRKIKPQIPLYGFESIPIRDEIELEIILHSYSA